MEGSLHFTILSICFRSVDRACLEPSTVFCFFFFLKRLNYFHDVSLIFLDYQEILKCFMFISNSFLKSNFSEQ